MNIVDVFVFGVALIVVIAGFFVMAKRSFGSKNRNDFRIEDREAWAKRWAELEGWLSQGESHWQVAIIEADKLLDRVLKSMHLHGDTMGERLKFLTLTRTDLKFVWSAHLLRNRLAHESNFQLNRRMAAEALNTYKQALKKLGVL